MWIRRKINADTWTSWVKVWTAENDGTGSGLDADTVDGVHISNIQTPKVTGDDGSAISLSSGFDVNNLKTTGFYRGDATNNRPPVSPGNPAAWFFYQVITHDPSWITQVAYEYGTTMIYNRTCSGGVWGEWNPMRGGTYVASNTVREQNLTEYSNIYRSSAFGLLVYKFVPRFTGEVVIAGEVRGAGTSTDSDDNTIYNYGGFRVWAPRSKSQFISDGYGGYGGSMESPAYGLGLFDYRTPLGTYIAYGQAYQGEYGHVTFPYTVLGTVQTINTSYTYGELTISVQSGVPIYVFTTCPNGGANCALRNMQIKYNII
jgi:hypothetical protein